jgi:hypothetical protein
MCTRNTVCLVFSIAYGARSLSVFTQKRKPGITVSAAPEEGSKPNDHRKV